MFSPLMSMAAMASAITDACDDTFRADCAPPVSRFGEILGELPLGHRANLPLAVENDRAGTARSLIQ